MENFFNFAEVVRFFLKNQAKKNEYLKCISYDTSEKILKRYLLRFCEGLLNFAKFYKIVNVTLVNYRVYLIDISIHRELYLLHFVCLRNPEYSFGIVLRQIDGVYFLDYIEQDR